MLRGMAANGRLAAMLAVVTSCAGARPPAGGDRIQEPPAEELAAGVSYEGGAARGRQRARSLGIELGVTQPGPLNAITDVTGVQVGHLSLIKGSSIRTGVTVVLPHGGNLYQEKVPAAVVVGNGYGKLAGATQVKELGEIEAPIILTNTLNVAEGIAAGIEWSLGQPGNEDVRSVNVVVGETNDGYLNDIRSRALTKSHMLAAIRAADTGPVDEGSVGAGVGTIAYQLKGGIGSSSRELPKRMGGYTVGVLVQSNHGGVLKVDGVPYGLEAAKADFQKEATVDGDGSIMIVVATDAPLSDRNLARLARRALSGLARAGASMTNGSGDYVIAFSTAATVRRVPSRRTGVATFADVPNDEMSPLFLAVIEATEEAVLNSLLMATAVESVGADGEKRRVEAIGLEAVRTLVRSPKPPEK